MKMESMAQFLISGDIILHNRKKYEVVNVSTKSEETTILYKVPNSNVQGIITANKSEFFKIISPFSLEILDKIIGVEEAAELWGLSSGHIKNLCAKNKIQSKKIGKTWVIFKDQPNPKFSK